MQSGASKGQRHVKVKVKVKAERERGFDIMRLIHRAPLMLTGSQDSFYHLSWKSVFRRTSALTAARGSIMMSIPVEDGK
nr:hypothetical protein CFP56_30116 [Quercus suber]